MKFSELKNSKLALSSDQMRKISGGSGTCGYKAPNGNFKCNISKTEALFWISDGQGGVMYGAWWCCDSCASTSYCG